MSKIIIIIPTLNEEKNILKIVKRIFKVNNSYQILFIDDGSTDRSQTIIKDLNQKYKKIKYIFRTNKTGIGSAHKTAIKFCYKRKFDFIITMDADGTHNPNKIPQMLKLMKKQNLHVVNTSRFVIKHSLPGWPIVRKIMTYTRHYLIKFFLNMEYDASGAFRLYNTKFVKISNILLAKDNRYAFFWESLYILKMKKNKINEIPISLPYRVYGSSKMRFSDILNSFLYLIIISFKKF